MICPTGSSNKHCRPGERRDPYRVMSGRGRRPVPRAPSAARRMDPGSAPAAASRRQACPGRQRSAWCASPPASQVPTCDRHAHCHCERSEAIQGCACGPGLLRRFAPRNDGGETCVHLLAAHLASELCCSSCPPEKRARGMPGAGRTHGPPAKKMQAAGTTGSAETSRHSPRDGFDGCFAFSPVLRAFWPPCAQCAFAHYAGHQRRDARTTRLDRAHRRCSSAWRTTLQHRHAHRIPPQRP